MFDLQTANNAQFIARITQLEDALKEIYDEADAIENMDVEDAEEAYIMTKRDRAKNIKEIISKLQE
jgi:hypothetical protein